MTRWLGRLLRAALEKAAIGAIISSAALMVAGCNDYSELDNGVANIETRDRGDIVTAVWPRDVPIVVEDGVVFRVDPNGGWRRLSEIEGNSVIVGESGNRYLVDPDGTRVRIDPANPGDIIYGNRDSGVVIRIGNSGEESRFDGNEPRAKMSNASGEADGSSRAINSLDPEIARLCRAAELSARACTSLNNQFQNLDDGVGALNAPAEMNLGVPYTVALAIGREEDETEVYETAKAEAGPAATSDVGDVQLAQRMRVTLSGSAFRITPEGDNERELGLSRQATWRWQVVPTAEGSQSLVATIEPIAALPDGRRLELRPARRRLDVQVSVTPEQRIGRVERFLKSTTGILLAVAAVIAAISLIVWRIRTFGLKPD